MDFALCGISTHNLCVARCNIKLKAYINLKTIRNNLIGLRAHVRTRIIFMVKANAYGHGLREVATATEDLVDAFGVATIEEGIELRQCGIAKPILLLICAESELKSAIENKLTVCLSNALQIDMLEKLINSGKVRVNEVKTHISLDTGMHRLGFCFEQLDETLSRLVGLGIEVRGAYSHLRVRSNSQIAMFEKMCKKVREYYPNVIRHLTASHALDVKRLRYDAVRVGISAYLGAMRVESVVVAARRVRSGEYVSYGNFRVEKDTNTAVIFGGYADGVARERPSSVYIRGRECRVLGNVCMDMSIVDCCDFLPDIGEKAVLLDGDLIEKISKQRGSIPYTLMTCWRGRIERIYDDKSGSEEVCKSCYFKDEQ